jgi:prophage DNA circulation protein
MRDWEATLWPASFGGVPFYVEKDKALFGKKIVVHEFPERDDPFVEELGQSARHYDFNAYVASDFADVQADGLVAMLVAAGPNILVVPDQGPVSVIFKSGQRDREKDRMGYVAFQLSFVAQGAGSAVASGAYLGQLVSDAVDSLAAGAATLMGNLGL